MSLERLPIQKEFIPQFQEISFQLCTPQVLRWCTVMDQLSEILGAAAPEIEQRGPFFKPLQNQRIGRGATNAEIKEGELSNTWIRVDFPSSVTLFEVSRQLSNTRKNLVIVPLPRCAESRDLGRYDCSSLINLSELRKYSRELACTILQIYHEFLSQVG